MRERLIASLKQLPALTATWGQSGDGSQASAFSQNLIKQLRTLSVVRTPPWPPEISTLAVIFVYVHKPYRLKPLSEP